MRVRLYSKPKVGYTQSREPDRNAVKSIYDRISRLYTNYIPGDYAEELLGEFSAAEITQPNGGKHILVNTPRTTVRLHPATLTKETEVTTFRAEIV